MPSLTFDRCARAGRPLSGLLCVGLFFGCGGDEPAQSETGVRTEAATAAEVAKDSRGRLRCPPRLATAPRDKAAPVDDILGVRPGLSVEEARALVLCSHELLVATFDSSNRYTLDLRGAQPVSAINAGFAEPYVPVTAENYLSRVTSDRYNRVERLAAGTSAWQVGFVGLPGEERVSDVSREEMFADGEQPTLDALEAALNEKYGSPIERRADNGALQMRWNYDLQGRSISEASPLYHACFTHAARGGPIRYSSDCGLSIAARVTPLTSNELLAASLTVTIVDQASAYARMMAMEQQLARSDSERKEREAREAARNTRKPVL